MTRIIIATKAIFEGCPQSDNQNVLLNAIDGHLCLALGPAGTGKTYLAIAKAVEALEEGRVGRIILSRPAVEAGESLGFLPGDMEEKLAPYLRPLYDALNDRLGGKRLRAMLDDGAVEIAPVGYMRGRTLNNSFIVIDENCTYGQIKMLLTRLVGIPPWWLPEIRIVRPAVRHVRPRRYRRPAGGVGGCLGGAFDRPRYCSSSTGGDAA